MSEQLILMTLSLSLPVGQWLVGSGKTLGWVINILGQIGWVIFVLMTGFWGMLPSTLIFTAVLIRNLKKWRYDINRLRIDP